MDWAGNHMAEVIGIIGILVSFAGFVVAIMQIVKTRKAAIAAKASSDETKRVIEKNALLIDVAACLKLLDHAKSLIRSDKYESALIHTSDLSAQLIQAKNLGTLSTDTYKSRFSEMLAQLTILREGLEKKVDQRESNYNKTLAIRKLSVISDTLNDLLGKIKFRTNTGGIK